MGAGALGAGITAGIGLAGGLPGLLGGFGALGGAGSAGSVMGALAPGVASTIAPAAASQLAGTIGASAIPGIQGGLGALAPGATSGATSGLASALPGAANPALASQIAQQQTVANAARQRLLAQSGGTDVMGAATQRAAASPYSFTTGKEIGLNPSAMQQMSLANPKPVADVTSMVGNPISPNQNFMQNLGSLMQNPSMQGLKDYAAEHPYATSAAVGLGTQGLMKMMQQKGPPTPENNAMIRPYDFDYGATGAEYQPGGSTSEQLYFNPTFTAGEPYKADEKAEGGIASAYAMGGPVEQMSAMNSVGANTGYPMANINTPLYANPMMQLPEATNVIAPSADAGVGAYSGEPRFAEGGEAKTEGGYKYSFDPTTQQFTQLSVPTIAPQKRGMMGMAGTIPYVTPTPQPVKNSGSKLSGGIATPAMGPMQSQQASTPTNIPVYQTPEQQLGLDPFYALMGQQLAGYGGYAKGGNVGGEANLGDYSDGGRLLKGPGDGVSDSIPAVIGKRQPARLADGEFVVPARIVSELGNGSTEAGARKLYAMMERVQKGRRKSVGKGKVAVNSKADKHLPA
jgi:hypothetical protein